MSLNKRLKTALITLLVLFGFISILRAGYLHEPFCGYDRFTRSVSENVLEGNLFSYNLPGIELASIWGKTVTLVSDQGTNRVVYSIGSDDEIKITSLGGFNNPGGVSGGDDGLFFVADKGNNHIARLYYSDEVLYYQYAIGEGILKQPMDVKRIGNQIYVADTYNSQIVRFNLDGSQPYTYGNFGLGEGQFMLPHSVTKKGQYIYVADTYNRRVVRLQENQNGFIWINSITVPGANSKIVDIEVDSHGYVYVVDSFNCRILKFNPELSVFIQSFGSCGIEPNNFNHPFAFWMSPETSKTVISEIWDYNSGLTSWRLTVKAFEAQIHYPNSDSRGYDASLPDSMRITYKIDGVANVYITLPGGRTLYQPDVPAGVEQAVWWDGKDSLGNLVLPGNYTVRVHPVDAFPGGHYESEDTTLPLKVAGTHITTSQVCGQWLWNGSPYILDGSNSIYGNDTLRVGPGVKVLFRGNPYYLYLSATGPLIAEGKADSLILFSSYKKPCDRHSGDWCRLQFYLDTTSVMDHCVVSYGGTPYGNYQYFGSVLSYYGSPMIRNSRIEHSGSQGLYFLGSYGAAKPRVDTCTFSSNDSCGIYLGSGSRPIIEGCSFDHHLHSYLIRMAGVAYPQIHGCVADGTNRMRGVELSNCWAGDPKTVWEPWAVQVVKDLFTVNGLDTLVVEPGSVVKFGNGPSYYNYMNVAGSMRAVGSADSEIVFTSLKDDSHGGDTNGDSDSTVAHSGDWCRVQFYLDTTSVMNHCVVSYGGAPYGNYQYDGSILSYYSSPTIRNSRIEHSGSQGLYFLGSYGAAKPRVDTCTFSLNDSGGVTVQYGGNPTIHGCSFLGNALWGVFNGNTSLNIDATGNWWGHESGPLDDSQGPPDYNPCGQGNKVSDYVTYRSWLGDPGLPAMVSQTPGAGEYNNSVKFIKDISCRLHAVYCSGNYSYYSYSTDWGTSWAVRETLGEGIYPALVRDGDDSLYACWMKQANPDICGIDTLARLYYSYRNNISIWTSPYALVSENSYNSPRVVYSPPDLGVISDTVRIVYERLQATMFMMGWNTNWKLFYGSFPVHNPQAVQWRVLDSLNLTNVPNVPPTPIAPSINVDFNGLSHVVWQKEGVIYSRQQVQDTIWTTVDTVSQPSGNVVSSHPSSYLYGSRLNAVWEQALGGDKSVIHYRGRWLGEPWESDQTLGNSQSRSHVPVVDGNAVVAWSELVDSLNREIYYTKWNGMEWETPVNVSNTKARSSDPQLIYTPFIIGNDYQFLWTEGDSAPYHLTYLDIYSPWKGNPGTHWMSPWYSSDVGRVKLSPFTVEREGYLSYGSSRQKTIDYGSHSVVGEGVDAGSNGLAYHFTRLDTTYCYRLELVAYFEKKEGKSGENSGAGNSQNSSATLDDKGEDKINQSVLLNSQKVGEMELVPGQPDTFSFAIPKDMYRRGRLDFVLDKKNGKFACLSELALYRWKEKEKNGAQVQGGGGPQSSGEVELLPKVYELSQSYPNPARDRVTIRYALPKASQVNLSVYNISGQLIRKLVNARQKAAYHVVLWDGRDESGRRVSNGVYLYRIEAGDYAKTRKLVVVR